MSNWAVYSSEDLIEIVPIDDIAEHIPHEWCECNPKVEGGGFVLIHNSFDLREVVEETVEILNNHK